MILRPVIKILIQANINAWNALLALTRMLGLQRAPHVELENTMLVMNAGSVALGNTIMQMGGQRVPNVR